MEINEALDSCLAGMLAPSERLLALAISLSRQDSRLAAGRSGGIMPLRPARPEAEVALPVPADIVIRNRAVLGHAHAMLSQAIGQLGSST